MYLLALLYLEGEGIEKDILLETHWLKQAVALNHSQAMIEYACYLKEFEPEQQLQAISVFHQAATLKHHSAYYYLRLAYLEGNILSFDINNAIKLFQHAERLEEPQSQLKLACIYLEGPGFKRNHQAFLDAQLKLQDIETELSHQPR